MIAVLVVVAGMILPALPGKGGRAHRISCVNSLKQIGTAFRLFANDYDGRYPFQVLAEATNGFPDAAGLLPFNTNDATQVWKLFQAAGYELSSPRILVCPADTRAAAADFASTNASSQSFAHPSQRLKALSYFYGLNSREDDPNQFVVGDRNLTTGGSDTDPGKALLTGRVDLANFTALPKPGAGKLQWGLGLHDKAGNVGFSDGRVEQLTSGKLREAALNAGSTNNVLWMPNLPQPMR